MNIVQLSSGGSNHGGLTHVTCSAFGSGCDNSSTYVSGCHGHYPTGCTVLYASGCGVGTFSTNCWGQN